MQDPKDMMQAFGMVDQLLDIQFLVSLVLEKKNVPLRNKKKSLFPIKRLILLKNHRNLVSNSTIVGR